MYGPPCVNDRFGLIISLKMTESSPYLLRNSFAHSIPSWPRPPIWMCFFKQKLYIIDMTGHFIHFIEFYCRLFSHNGRRIFSKKKILKYLPVIKIFGFSLDLLFEKNRLWIDELHNNLVLFNETAILLSIFWLFRIGSEKNLSMKS